MSLDIGVRAWQCAAEHIRKAAVAVMVTVLAACGGGGSGSGGGPYIGPLPTVNPASDGGPSPGAVVPPSEPVVPAASTLTVNHGKMLYTSATRGPITLTADVTDAAAPITWRLISGPGTLSTTTGGQTVYTPDANDKTPNDKAVVVVKMGAASQTLTILLNFASSAMFQSLKGLALDAQGNIYVADAGNNKVRKITPQGMTSTVATTAEGILFDAPSAVAVAPDGSVYIADTGNTRICRLAPDGSVSVVAGSQTAGRSEGIGKSAQFLAPIGVAEGKDGSVYVMDVLARKTARVLKIAPNGNVRTLAGITTINVGYVRRSGLVEDLFHDQMPGSIVVDSDDNVYVVGRTPPGPHAVGSTVILQITPQGTVTQFAGGAGADEALDGVKTDARFTTAVKAMTIDKQNNLYVIEGGRYLGGGESTPVLLRKISPSGAVKTIAGADGTVKGSATSFTTYPALAADGAHRIYMAGGSGILGGDQTVSMYTPSDGFLTLIAGLPFFKVGGVTTGDAEGTAFPRDWP